MLWHATTLRAFDLIKDRAVRVCERTDMGHDTVAALYSLRPIWIDGEAEVTRGRLARYGQMSIKTYFSIRARGLISDSTGSSNTTPVLSRFCRRNISFTLQQVLRYGALRLYHDIALTEDRDTATNRNTN